MTSLAPVTAPDKTGVEVVVDEGGDTVSIAGRAHEAEGLFFSYRMACHPHSGLSGALSALALGCMSAQGKRALQADIQPTIARSVCGGCGLCITLCSRGAIRHTGHVAVMKPELCLVNGDCQTECHTGALTMPPRGGEIFQGRLAAAAAGAARGKEGRMLWLGFLLHEPDRGGVNLAVHKSLPDLGLLAGTDPLALDLAAVKLMEQAIEGPLGKSCGAVADPGILLEAARDRGFDGSGDANHSGPRVHLSVAREFR